jgi:hypothetical protein
MPVEIATVFYIGVRSVLSVLLTVWKWGNPRAAGSFNKKSHLQEVGFFVILLEFSN